VFHTKVEPGVMGRTIGLKNMVIGGSHLSGNVLAGLLGAAAQPLVGRSDVRSATLALFIGHGHRWYALVMILVALVVIAMVYRAYRSRSLMRIQDDLPDVTPEDTAASVAVAPGLADAPAPTPASTPASAPTPVSAQAPTPVSAQASVSAQAPTPVSAPAQASVSAPASN
jgi:hypothetical protein